MQSYLIFPFRTVNDEQRKIILNAFNGCPLPLYLRLATDIALKWHSYTEVSKDDIAADMPGMNIDDTLKLVIVSI